MALSVTHTKVATTPDDPAFEVGTSEWNAAHTISGTPDGVPTIGGNVGEVLVADGSGNAAGVTGFSYDSGTLTVLTSVVAPSYYAPNASYLSITAQDPSIGGGAFSNVQLAPDGSSFDISMNDGTNPSSNIHINQAEIYAESAAFALGLSNPFVSVNALGYNVNSTPGVPASIVIPGVGTATFVGGILTDFTPE